MERVDGQALELVLAANLHQRRAKCLDIGTSKHLLHAERGKCLAVTDLQRTHIARYLGWPIAKRLTGAHDEQYVRVILAEDGLGLIRRAFCAAQGDANRIDGAHQRALAAIQRPNARRRTRA